MSKTLARVQGVSPRILRDGNRVRVVRARIYYISVAELHGISMEYTIIIKAKNYAKACNV